MKYFELYKNDNDIILKSYLKEYDTSNECDTCWKIKRDGKFVACEDKDFQEPEIHCRVRVPFERPYADTEIVIDVRAEEKVLEDEIVDFIQKNVDVECKKYDAPDLNWYNDRYIIKKGYNEGKFVNWTYTRTIPFLD